MTSCPVPDPTSIGYLTGSYLAGNELGLQDVCPVVLVGHGAPQTTPGLPRHQRLDLDLSDIPHSIGAMFRLVATLLVFISTPVFWLLGALFSVLSMILGLTIYPLLIPWRITVWFWELLGDLYEDNKVSTPPPSYLRKAIPTDTPTQPIIIYVSTHLRPDNPPSPDTH